MEIGGFSFPGVRTLAVVPVVRDHDPLPRPPLNSPAQTQPVVGVAQHPVRDDNRASSSGVDGAGRGWFEVMIVEVDRRVSRPVELPEAKGTDERKASSLQGDFKSHIFRNIFSAYGISGFMFWFELS